MTSQFIGELLGTMVLILLGNGVVANVVLNKSKGNSSGWIVITAGWGLAVVMGVFTSVATGAPQADLNPAVTLAKLMAGVYDMGGAVTAWIAQLIGAFIGACLVYLTYLCHWAETPDPGAKLACFSTGPAIRNSAANLITEIIGTIALIFVIFAIFSKATGAIPAGLGPYLVGMLVWSIGLSLGGPTGYAINPARDLGPRIAHAVLPIAGKGESDWGYAWIPVVGPMIGGAIAFFLGKTFGLL